VKTRGVLIDFQCSRVLGQLQDSSPGSGWKSDRDKSEATTPPPLAI
jgi:hypothetical protein